MSEDAKHVTIHRDRGFYAIFRKLVVQVDGTELLGIKAGETMQTSLPAGARQLDMRMDWITTPPVDLAEVRTGDTLTIYIQRRSFQDMSSLKEIPFAIRIDRS